MTLTFVDTHNMIVYLTKSDASEGFNQIINFLNGSSIKYALIVNPNIYVSCIKLFWTSVAVKKVNDVMRLQALVDKKKVIITEAKIRDALHLDDADGIECLPNEKIFTELARMGYEKPSTKLTFYKAFFSSQKQVGDLSSHTTKYSSLALTQKVFANIRRVGNGCSGVETTLFAGMIVEQQVGEDVVDVHVDDVSTAGVVAEGDVSTADDVVPTAVEEPSIPSPTPPTQSPPPRDNIAQALKITKLKQRVKKLERRNKASKLKRLQKVGTAQRIETSDDTVMDDVSKQGRMIADMDADVDVTLKDVAAQDAEIKESLDVQGRQAESQAQICKIDLEHADKVLSMQDDEEEPVELQEVVEVVTTAKLITEVVTAASATITTATPQLNTVVAPTLTTAPSAARRRKGVVIRNPKETTTSSIIIHSEAKSKDKGRGILKEENVVKRYQALKRKPQTEAQAKKNMMIYLRNVVGFKMDYFKGMTYDDIRLIFEKKFNSNVDFLLKIKEQMDEEDSRALKRLSESQDDKTTKKP
nr:hypothetical protein [Tanacetum cinerariifolium]